MKPYPVWYSPSDCAKADAEIREFSDRAWEHKEGCEVCRDRQPCTILHVLIDEIEETMRLIGDTAFPRYVSSLENKYSHRDYWSDG